MHARASAYPVGSLLEQLDGLNQPGHARRGTDGRGDVHMRSRDVVQLERHGAAATGAHGRRRDRQYAARLLKGFAEREPEGKPRHMPMKVRSGVDLTL